jgi:hypothetical protein
LSNSKWHVLKRSKSESFKVQGSWINSKRWISSTYLFLSLFYCALKFLFYTLYFLINHNLSLHLFAKSPIIVKLRHHICKSSGKPSSVNHILSNLMGGADVAEKRKTKWLWSEEVLDSEVRY